MKLFKSLVRNLNKRYLEAVFKREHSLQQFTGINERPVEFQFVFRCLTRTVPITVLDVGTGTTALPRLIRNCGFVVTAIDNVHDYWSGSIYNRHFYVINDDITHPLLAQTFDFITCVSVLEHIPKHNDAVRSMFTLLNPGGYLALTFPYNESRYIHNVYKLPGAGYGQDSPYICQVYSRNELSKWLETNNGQIMEQEYWRIFEGDFWTFGQQLYPPVQVRKNEKHQLTCLLVRKS